MFNQSGSRRWTHFHSALQLAIQRSAHKWTFEDFAECFPSYTEENRNGAFVIFNSISDYIENQIFSDLDKAFKEYKVQENIDVLHKVVNEGKDRKVRDELGKDVWQENLQPRSAVAAKTVPILQLEVKRVRAELAAIEEENSQVQVEVEAIKKATDDANQRVVKLLDGIDNVCEKWKELPVDDMEHWTVRTVEALKPPPP